MTNTNIAFVIYVTFILSCYVLRSLIKDILQRHGTALPIIVFPSPGWIGDRYSQFLAQEV